MQIQQKQARGQTDAQVAAITKDILAVYDDVRKDINKELADLYAKTLSGVKPEDYYNIAIKQERLKSFLAQIDSMYRTASVKAGALTAEASTLAMSNSYYKNQFVADWFAPVAGTDLTFTAIPEELVRASITGNIDAWNALDGRIRGPIEAKFGTIDNYIAQNGQTLSAILLGNRQAEITKINRSITSGLLQGKGYRETAKDVARVIGAITPDKTTGALASAFRIVRTESNRAYNAGSFANSQAVSSQGLDIQRMWVATFDSRTRDTHGTLDGALAGVDEPFKSGGVTAMYPGDFPTAALSVNCRCTTIDVVDGIPPSARRGVNPVTGESEIYDWQKYDDWKKSNGLRTTPNGRTINTKTTQKPPPKKAIVKGSATIADAEARALKELNGLNKVSYRNLDVKTADAITDSLLDNQSRYGDLDLQEVSTYKAKGNAVMFARMRSDKAGGYQRQIRINANKTGGGLEDVNAYINGINKSGWWTSKTIGDITTHEIGHILMYRGKSLHEIRRATDKVDDMISIRSGVSKYATTNGSEAMSEALVAFNRGDPISAGMKSALKEFLGVEA